MSDPNETQMKAPAVQPPTPETPPAPVVATSTTPTVPDVSDVCISSASRSARRGGAVASICDALKELFGHAPKRALGWVCAGVAFFVVLCGVGIMVALIQYGWPSMAAKQLQNWEVVNDSGKAVVELRTATEDGKIETSKIDVPKEVTDPKAWAIERYGEQKPLKKMELIPLEPATDTSLAVPTVPAPEVKP